MPYIGKQPANVPVTADDIPNDSITSAKILDNVITISDIGPNAVGNSEMADDAIGLNELSASGTTNSSTFLRGDNSWAVPPNTVYTHPNHSGDVTSSADGATTIANNAVTTAKIAGDAITALKIADDVINATHIEDGQILTAALGADAVTGAKIANDSINSEHYVNGSIDAQHIASEAVTTAKIAGGNVTTAKIADDNVTAAKLANSINTDIATGVAALPKAGGTMTGDLNFGDNVDANFGASGDLKIYHDGNRSYVQDVGTSSLIIDTDGPEVDINSGGNAEFMGRFIKDGAVKLYYDANQKFETTAAGATVTGNLAVTGTVDGVDIQTLNTTASAALPKAGGTITGALTANATITLGTSAYFIGANTTNAYTFNSVGDAANLFIIKNDGRAHSDFTARAWCHFSGSGTPSFWGSAVHNVSSLTDVATGNWKVNFANAMANTNYLAVGSGQGGLNCSPDGWATTYVTLNLRVEATNASADGGHVGVVVFTEA